MLAGRFPGREAQNGKRAKSVIEIWVWGGPPIWTSFDPNPMPEKNTRRVRRDSHDVPGVQIAVPSEALRVRG